MMKVKMSLLFVFILMFTIVNQKIVAKSLPNNGDCIQDVSVFTTDTAPTDGWLFFNVQLDANTLRRDGNILQWWEVTKGQRIDEVVSKVLTPRWVNIWWWPHGEDSFYLLPSQYWHGNGNPGDLYGVSCTPAEQPSYHTSFDLAIPESEILLNQPCSNAPILISPADGEFLDTTIPLFAWNYGNEPNATLLRIDIAEDANFSMNPTHFKIFSFIINELPFDNNFKPNTTYYWQATYTCADGNELSSEIWSFTTGNSNN